MFMGGTINVMMVIYLLLIDCGRCSAWTIAFLRIIIHIISMMVTYILPHFSIFKQPVITNVSSGSSNNTMSTADDSLRPTEMSSAGDDEDDFGEHEQLETKLNNGNNNGLATSG